jgi:plastocyanin
MNSGRLNKAMNMKKLVWMLVVALFWSGVSLGHAQSKKSRSGGTLKGKLTVTAPPRKVIKADGGDAAGSTDAYGYDNPSATPSHTLPEQVVIYLKKVPGTYTPPEKHARLDQNYRQFTLRVLPVLKGTTVDFTNHDTVYHNVFTNSQVNKFDLGRKKSGETVSKKLKYPEIPVKVYCDIHSAMRAYILVLNNPFFTTVGPDQTFEINGIPPGTYTMVAWHDYWEPVEKKITIKKGKTTRADVVLDKVAQ